MIQKRTSGRSSAPWWFRVITLDAVSCRVCLSPLFKHETMHFVILSSSFYNSKGPGWAFLTFGLLVYELSIGFIYVIGGISDEGMELRSAEMYDPISRRWSTLPVMVTRRAYVGVACLNNCIYAVGGWNEALGALETVEKYCPEEVTFEKGLLAFSDSFQHYQ